MLSEKYNIPFLGVLLVTSGTGNSQWSYLLCVSNSVLTFLQDYIFTGMPTAKLSLIASTLVLGAIVGAFSGGQLSARFGRRKMLFISDFVTLVGVGLTMISSYGALIVGRIIEGYGLGLLSCISPVYTAEMMPTPIRGTAGVINGVMLYLGMVISLAVGFTVPKTIGDGETNNGWRICYAFVAVFPLIRIIFFTFLQKFETPVYYINKNNVEGARQILRKIYKQDSEIVLERLIKDRQYLETSGAKKTSYSDLLTKKYRKAVLLGIFMVLIHQFSGIGFMFAYSKRLFQYGLDPQDSLPSTLTLLIGVISVISTIVSSFFIDKLGRRKQYIPSLVCLSAICFAYAIIATIYGPEHTAAKVLILIYPIFFALSGGSITFLYLGEVLSEIAISAVIPFQWVFSFIVAEVSLSLLESIGSSGIFFIFVGFAALGAAVTNVFLIESKGKSKAEMIALFSGISENKIVPKMNPKEDLEAQVKTPDEIPVEGEPMDHEDDKLTPRMKEHLQTSPAIAA